MCSSKLGLHLGKQVGFDWPQEGRSVGLLRQVVPLRSRGEMATLDPRPREDRSPSPAVAGLETPSPAGAFESGVATPLPEKVVPWLLARAQQAATNKEVH